MKQLLFLGVAAVLAAFLAAGGLTGSSGTVHADPFNNVFTYKTTWSTLAVNSAPNLDVQVGIDCPLGSGGCPATTSAPFFDIAVTQYGQNVHGCDGTAVGAGSTRADGMPSVAPSSPGGFGCVSQLL